MNFLVLALATFRISSLVAKEDGPFYIIDWLRQFFGVRKDEHGLVYGLNNFATGLICQWCNSVWIAIILTVIYMLFKEIAVWICLPFALSTVTMVLERWVDG